MTIKVLRKDTINEAIILFCGQKARVKCDRKCSKAWGLNRRSRQQLSETDEEDYCFLADSELREAPRNPGTYECGSAKPLTPDEFPQKWCVRECERCAISSPGKWMNDLELKEFEVRSYNIDHS